jgi:aldehyde dehydrogenase (NAD+)
VTSSTLGSIEHRMLIGGELVDSAQHFDNINPATEQVCGTVADGTAADMDRAIGAARRAFDRSSWSYDRDLRRRCLTQLRDALVAEREHLLSVISTESGSPIAVTYQVDAPIEDLTYWIGVMDAFEYERDLPTVTSFGMPSRRLLQHEAIGVVGAITPWNYPLYLNMAEVAPALAAGCTVVLKPAPDTPWAATELGRLAAEHTDMPPGVLNVVTSSDHLVGQQLASDPRVDMISFTGSTATGRKVLAAAASTVKKTFLELGGKSPHIVLDDADLASVLPGAAPGLCMHAGQGCTLLTRMLLPRSRYEEGVEILGSAFAGVPYGDPRDPSVIQGPQINRRQQEKILGYIATGVEQGARVVTGGSRPAHLPSGYFVEPTVLADVRPGSVVEQEEIFGPVLVVVPYDTVEEAVAIANGTMYGLSAHVSSASEDRALAVARQLRSGTVSINNSLWLAPDTPFGGYRQSGLGRRNGDIGFAEYMELKAISLPSAS